MRNRRKTTSRLLEQGQAASEARNIGFRFCPAPAFRCHADRDEARRRNGAH